MKTIFAAIAFVLFTLISPVVYAQQKDAVDETSESDSAAMNRMADKLRKPDPKPASNKDKDKGKGKGSSAANKDESPKPPESRAGGGAGSDNGIGVLAMAAFNAHQGMPPMMVPTPAVPSVDLGRVAIEAEMKPCKDNAVRRFIPVKGLNKPAFLCPEEIGKINLLPLQGAATPAAQAPPPAQADESQTSTPIWEPKWAINVIGVGIGLTDFGNFAAPATFGVEFRPTVYPVWFRGSVGVAVAHANDQYVARLASQLGLLYRGDNWYAGLIHEWVGRPFEKPEPDKLYRSFGPLIGYQGDVATSLRIRPYAEGNFGYRWSGMLGDGWRHLSVAFGLRKEF